MNKIGVARCGLINVTAWIPFIVFAMSLHFTPNRVFASGLEDKEMVSIPFKMDFVYDVSFPPGAVGVPMEGAWDGSAKFVPPVHPVGTINDLTCNGNKLDLISAEIHQGFIKTKEFGDIEVLLLGTGPRGSGFEFRATTIQINKMKKTFGLKVNHGIKSDPKDDSSYQSLGAKYYQEGQYDLAIKNFSKAIEMNLKDEDSYLGRGMSYSKKSQLDLAIIDFSKAIKLNPKNKYAYKFRSDCYFEKGQKDLAMQDYIKVIELDPDQLQRLENSIGK